MKLPFRVLKTSSLIGGLTALLLGALPFPALAQSITQSTQLQAAVKSISEDASAQETLIKIFDLTLAEIKDLSEKDRLIDAVENTDLEIATLAQLRLDTLKTHEAYIEVLRQQATDKTTSLDTLKEMAVDFKAWRSDVYEVNTKEIFDLLLFLQARAVLSTANSRLILINSDVKKLSVVASKVDMQALNQFLATAQKNLKAAKQSEDLARTALFEQDPDKKASASDALQKNLKEEFSKISQTYTKVFFLMSKIAQKY